MIENKQLALERIAQRIKKSYINILPHSKSKKLQLPKTKAEKLPPSKQFSKKQIHQILGQMNTILQLLTQNYLLTNNKELKSRCYALIKDFRAKMNYDLDFYDQLIRKKFEKPMKKYKVDYSTIPIGYRCEIVTEIYPQVSIYQDVLLTYLFHSIIHSQVFKNQILQDYEAMNIILRQVPIFNQLFIPILSKRQKRRSKFSAVEDQILMIGIIKYGYKNAKTIQSVYFHSRTQLQIKNRIKNLFAKPSYHPIRLWRLSQQQQLTDSQMKKLVQVFEQLGPNWKVISRYYNMKSPNFFEIRYNPAYKQLNKEQNPAILTHNSFLSQKFMQRFLKFEQQYRISMQPQHLYLLDGNHLNNQSRSEQSNIMQWQHANICDMQMQFQLKDKSNIFYKLIGTQVFQYQQISSQ